MTVDASVTSQTEIKRLRMNVLHWYQNLIQITNLDHCEKLTQFTNSKSTIRIWFESQIICSCIYDRRLYFYICKSYWSPKNLDLWFVDQLILVVITITGVMYMCEFSFYQLANSSLCRRSCQDFFPSVKLTIKTTLYPLYFWIFQY